MPTLDEYLAMMQPKEPSQREKLMSMIGNLGVGLLSAPTWQKGLARGGLLAYDAQQGAKDRSSADKMAMLQQYKMAQGLADADSQREKQTRMDQAAQSAFMPGSPGSPEMGPPTAQGDMQPPVAPTAPGYDMNKYLSSMNAIDPARAMQIHQAMKQPAATESPWAKINPKEYTPASLAAFSRSKNPADLVPIVAPEKADTPFGKVNPAEFTPGSLKQFIAGGMKDFSVLRKARPVGGGAPAAAPEPKWDSASGQFVYPPSADAPQGRAVQPQGFQGKNDQKELQSQKALFAVKEAKDIIDNATGSYLGAAYDVGAAAIGQAPEGAKAIAKLRVLEATLIANQPRMEGPQSDKDVMLYKQAAGQIGNPTVPNEIKKAALETIESLHSKYASLKSGGRSASGPIGPTAGTVVDGYIFQGGDPNKRENWRKQ